MAIGVLTEKDFESELNKLCPQPKVDARVVDINRGRPVGRLEVPEEIRKTIAEEALTGELTGKELAIKHSISPSSISAYKVGATSTASYHQPDNQLKQSVDEVKSEITASARLKLMDALNEITPERISGAKIRDIAGIAKDMSAVLKNTEPVGIGVQLNTQVLVYKPKMRNEDEFEVITVNQ